MERKKIENMVCYCENSERYCNWCNKCPHKELCDELEDIARCEEISVIPEHWDDEDIDYILDQIN